MQQLNTSRASSIVASFTDKRRPNLLNPDPWELLLSENGFTYVLYFSTLYSVRSTRTLDR